MRKYGSQKPFSITMKEIGILVVDMWWKRYLLYYPLINLLFSQEVWGSEKSQISTISDPDLLSPPAEISTGLPLCPGLYFGNKIFQFQGFLTQTLKILVQR